MTIAEKLTIIFYCVILPAMTVGVLAYYIKHFFHKDKNIAYGTALTTYLKAEVGFFIIGVIGIASILFILSDFVDLSITREDLLTKEGLNWKENLRLYFKTFSLLLGGFVQYIAFIYKKKGKVAIDKIADKLV